MLSSINNRRSIRKFLDTAIPERDIQEILKSGTKAPSAKNRQPWKFIVTQGMQKKAMLSVFRQGIEREESGEALLPESREFLAAVNHTVRIMEQAPVVILAVNRLGKGIFENMTAEERCYEVCNIQSVSAAIQNILLAATEKGIGSLWICDFYFAYHELREWLNTEGDLVAVIALGYPDEAPQARPRKPLEDVIEWCT